MYLQELADKLIFFCIHDKLCLLFLWGNLKSIIPLFHVNWLWWSIAGLFWRWCNKYLMKILVYFMKKFVHCFWLNLDEIKEDFLSHFFLLYNLDWSTSTLPNGAQVERKDGRVGSDLVLPFWGMVEFHASLNN